MHVADELTARVSKLQEAAQKLQQQKVAAEHDLATAQGRRDLAAATLESEFGVRDAEQARVLLLQVEADLAAECAKAEQELKEAGS